MGLCASSNVESKAAGTKVDNPLTPDESSTSPSSTRSIKSLPSSDDVSAPSAPGTRHRANSSSAEQKVKDLLIRRARKKVVVNVTDDDDLDDNAAAKLAESIAEKTKTEEEAAWIRATLAEKFFLFNDLEVELQKALIRCVVK